MLKDKLVACGALLFTASVGYAAVAGDATSPRALRPGAYEIEFRLELPHVAEFGERRTAALCVQAAQPGVAQGLGAVSDNNPLSACPASNVEYADGELAFDIACAGINAASGKARYRFGADWFEGRIAMKMGAKKMTMTEVQTGRRSGECAAASAPAAGAGATPQMQHQK